MLGEKDASLFYALLRFEEASLALRVALKLRIVDKLRDDSLSLGELADRFGFTSQGARTYFSLLSAMRVVEPSGDKFAATAVAKQVLTTGIDTSREPYLAMGSGDDVDQLVSLLRGETNGAPPLYGEESGGETLMDIDEVGSAVAHGLSSRARSFARPLAAAIASHADDAKSIVDVGAGSPYVADACLETQPSLEKVILVDRPNGMRFAREIAADIGMDTGKIEFFEADFFQSVPAADVYCVSNTAHDWRSEDYERLMNNIRDARTDGGLICIHEPLLLPTWSNDSEWLTALWMACYALTLFKLTAGQGSCYSVSEHDDILAKSGFDRIGKPIQTCDGCTALFYR